MSNVFALGALLVLEVCISKASGRVCEPTHRFLPSEYCRNDQYCCGHFNTLCCDYVDPDDVIVEIWAYLIGLLLTLIILAVILICRRVCRKRTTQSGTVYRAPSNTTGACTYYSVPGTNPPQQLAYPHNPNYTSAMNTENSSCLYSQDSARCHINMPPPAYNQAAEVHL